MKKKKKLENCYFAFFASNVTPKRQIRAKMRDSIFFLFIFRLINFHKIKTNKQTNQQKCHARACRMCAILRVIYYFHCRVFEPCVLQNYPYSVCIFFCLHLLTFAACVFMIYFSARIILYMVRWNTCIIIVVLTFECFINHDWYTVDSRYLDSAYLE